MRQRAKEEAHIGKGLADSASLKHSMLWTADDKILSALSAT